MTQVRRGHRRDRRHQHRQDVDDRGDGLRSHHPRRRPDPLPVRHARARTGSGSCGTTSSAAPSAPSSWSTPAASPTASRRSTTSRPSGVPFIVGGQPVRRQAVPLARGRARGARRARRRPDDPHRRPRPRPDQDGAARARAARPHPGVRRRRLIRTLRRSTMRGPAAAASSRRGPRIGPAIAATSARPLRAHGRWPRSLARTCSSVVLVHWNQPERCAATIEAFASPGLADVRIIVVDNGSDRSARRRLIDTIAASPHDVELISLGANRGFGPAANVGLRQFLSRSPTEAGDWVAVAPHDALPQPGALARLIEAAESGPASGLACADVGDGARPARRPVLRRHDPAGGAGRRAWSRPTTRTARCCVARRACLEEIGLFDERYFAYCEEADLGLRARPGGWDVGLVHGARVVNPCMRSGSPVADYLMHRNTLHLVRRCVRPLPRVRPPAHRDLPARCGAWSSRRRGRGCSRRSAGSGAWSTTCGAAPARRRRASWPEVRPRPHASATPADRARPRSTRRRARPSAVPAIGGGVRIAR